MHGRGAVRRGKGINIVISNDDMDNIIRIIKSPENTVVLIYGVTETVENDTKKQKGRFIRMLLGTLGASMLGNMLKA